MMRRAPELVIRLGLESEVSIVFEAATREDEMRLRRWLRKTRRLVHLQHALEGLLDDLDLHDERRAA